MKRHLSPEQQKTLDLALVDAAENNNVTRLKQLLDKGANPDFVDDRSFQSTTGKTALHNACIHGHTEVGVALLEGGANSNLYTRICGTKTINNATPLHYAAKYGNSTLVKALLEHGANPHAPKNALLPKDESGLTAMHYAARHGHVDVLLVLLKHDAFHSSNDCAQRTPLHLACKAGQDACAELLLKAGANPNMPARREKSPMHYAAKAIKMGIDKTGETVRILVAFGADSITLDDAGNLPEEGMTVKQIRTFRTAIAEGMKLRTKMQETTNKSSKNRRKNGHDFVQKTSPMPSMCEAILKPEIFKK